MAGLIDMVNRMAGSTGPFMKAWGEDVTGTVFATGSGKAVVEGPVSAEEDDAEDQRRQRREITAELTVADLVADRMNKTIVYDGVTYTTRERVRADSGMEAWRCVEARVMEAGRRPRL